MSDKVDEKLRKREERYDRELSECAFCLREICDSKSGYFVWRKVRHDLIVESDLALVNGGEPGNGFQERAFSGTIWPHNYRYLVWRSSERNSIQYLEAAIAG